MADLYSAELWAKHDFTSEDVTIPDDERWIIRTVTVFSAGLFGGIWFQIQRLVDSLTLYEIDTKTGLADAHATENELRIVLMEGATYTMKSAGGGDVCLFGYALTAP